jgi:hypothetical protein
MLCKALIGAPTRRLLEPLYTTVEYYRVAVNIVTQEREVLNLFFPNA